MHFRGGKIEKEIQDNLMYKKCILKPKISFNIHWYKNATPSCIVRVLYYVSTSVILRKKALSKKKKIEKEKERCYINYCISACWNNIFLPLDTFIYALGYLGFSLLLTVVVLVK